MREILFRGKRLYDNGAWEHGSLMCWPDGDCDIIVANEENKYTSDRYAVDPETVGEYTGFKDKDGTRIFEGDIVESNFRSPPNGPSCGVAVVVREEDGRWFLLGEIDRSLQQVAECWSVKVIGNIHDCQQFYGTKENERHEAEKQLHHPATEPGPGTPASHAADL